MTYRNLPVAELRHLAEGGVFTKPDSEAQFTLGQRYVRGMGVGKSDSLAAHWFALAADNGHVIAQRNLAYAHLYGRGLPKNEAEGVRRLRIAAEWGDAPSQRQLGFHYATGSGVPLDPKEGLHWFRLAADQGDYLAQYNIAFAYANGRGVAADPLEALHWYKLAAMQGMPEAQCALGLVFEHGLGVPVDHEQSVYWNRLAVEKNYAEACSNLGWMYENGLGVEQDLDEARHLYELAARQEYSEAKERLAMLRERHSNHLAAAPAKDRRASLQPSSESPAGADQSITDYLESAFAGLVGLDVVRQEVFRQASYIHVQKLRAKQGLRVPEWPSRHLVFLGNPGTGKTTIARIIAGLYQRLGLLKTDKVIETDRAGLVAPYVGQTALKTKAIVESALGGVLFIDEAYALTRAGQDFGSEAIETLLKMMEDHRDDMVVVVAGYTAEMDNFIHSNPGLASRFNRYLHFPDYTPAELLKILLNFCAKHSYALAESTHPGLLKIFGREIKVQHERFGNARYVRNLFEKIIEAQAQRVFALANASKDELQQILPADVEAALGEPLPVPDGVAANYEEVLKRLNRLIGLERVKKQVQRLFDFVRIQREREKAGNKVASGFSQHLVFTGNPGTGKTAVSRIVADLYCSLGIIPSNHIVEVDRSGLVAGYVGQSAIKTREVVASALGGVLFIDEAYALAQGSGENDFGREVIDTLLKAMEDHRDRIVVIVAGYSEPMEAFINSNPGLRSRFNHYIEFDDYPPHDLLKIFEFFCHESEYVLQAAAKTYLIEKLQTLFEAGKTQANGRFVRNIYERCIEVQSGRISSRHDDPGVDLNALTQPDIAAALQEVLQEQ
ncbi:MAG: AAA family ATPase [Burkholderiales bacterium]|nr:AAA family ATPase [Burkholderiales bacterium]